MATATHDGGGDVSMLGAMRLGAPLVAIITCTTLAACGGSTQKSSTQTTAGPAASARTSAGSSAATTASSSGRDPIDNIATTTSNVAAPPEARKAKGHAVHGTIYAASQGAHVETRITVSANGEVSPPAVSVPSGVGVELHITNHGSRTDTVALSVPGHPSVKVAPRATATLQTPGLKDGTYRIVVNGTPRGQLMIGAQGGP
jgi:hypothetical protein